MEESSYSSGKNDCYGKSKRSVTNNEGFLKKGPWKPEEDQVLINHVKKYGPRDWSSIRSKGLLLRTGKSCRLRWVNKLRPDLKNGCKFTAEEERIVIELQSQLGNKWATIATHLVGRTDNDVKNFWSSRQKRLARIFHSDQSPQSRKRIKSSSSTVTSLRSHSFSTEVFKTGLVQCSSSSSSAPNKELMLDAIPLNQYPCSNNQAHLDEVMSFPAIPALQTDLGLGLPPETQELIDRLDAGFLQPFGCTYGPGPGPVFADDGLQLSGQMSGSSIGVIDNPVTLDGFFDDFPSDMFDQIEPLPSPSSW